MTVEKKTLKLGKGAIFVKTKLLRLNQEDEIWEADFRALPKPMEQAETSFLGVVVALPHSTPMAFMPLDYTPNANDLADLLANAMQHPYIGSSHRPQQILLRDNPRWAELIPHVRQLGIEITTVDELPHADEECVDFQRQMRRATPDPVIVFTPKPFDVQNSFPSIAKWVEQYGHIEIGDQDGFGFVVRALDYGGMVFEDVKSKTFSEAMHALEAGLSRWFQEEVVGVQRKTAPKKGRRNAAKSTTSIEPHRKEDGGSTNAGMRELERVLAEVIDTGMTSVEVEFVGRKLQVFYRIGCLAFDTDSISKELDQAVMDELSRCTGPGKKSKGTLLITLDGKQCEFQVEKYDAFGKTAYRLTPSERRRQRD
jgi:hypothetical protein